MGVWGYSCNGFGVLRSLSQIVVRGLDSQWNPINVTSASGTVAQFTLPGALLSQSGFLEVAPIQDDGLDSAYGL